MSLDWGISSNRSVAPITGRPVMNEVAEDQLDLVSNDNFQWLDSDGVQHNMHPIKNQPKRPQWFE